MSKVSLAQQIDEIDHEITMRGRTYPRLVVAGKLTQAKADYHMLRINAVRSTLQWLADNAERIKRSAEFMERGK